MGRAGYLFFGLPVTSVKVWQKPSGYGNGLYRPAGEHPVNYIFIYGHFGMPELGGVGCGVATAAVYWVMFLAMVSYIKRARSMRDIRNEKAPQNPILRL